MRKPAEKIIASTLIGLILVLFSNTAPASAIRFLINEYSLLNNQPNSIVQQIIGADGSWINLDLDPQGGSSPYGVINESASPDSLTFTITGLPLNPVITEGTYNFFHPVTGSVSEILQIFQSGSYLGEPTVTVHFDIATPNNPLIPLPGINLVRQVPFPDGTPVLVPWGGGDTITICQGCEVPTHLPLGIGIQFVSEPPTFALVVVAGFALMGISLRQRGHFRGLRAC